MIDDGAVQRFEAAWNDGAPIAIDDCLPAEDQPGYADTLAELVLIDLEFRWKSCRSRSDERQAAARYVVEEYLKRFPCLRQTEHLANLLAQEYQVRHRFGDRPSLQLFRQRFPEVVSDGRALEGFLEKTRASFPQVPGYEISAVLGRGGMGVVYAARQLDLDRRVALKMLLAVPGQDSVLTDRFRAEAETVAQLQHANIVQIYEIGWSCERPFLCLERVEGGNLAERIDGAPQPERWSAEIVITLARAMATAHARGIIHRDLKPSNVLLDAENSPKISDFGLAKWLEADASHTRTGELLGTPSYMAPEQARGETNHIRPATDVYALGAILYELLTGRPPFRGETSWDTIAQVLDQDPVTLRQLQPLVSRDLETIALKCLRKEPAQRYATANELADDLQRYLDGQPIHARRIGGLGRALRWCRRNRALTATIASALVVVILVTAAGFWSVLRERDEVRRQRDRAQQLSADLAFARGLDLCEQGEIGRGLHWMLRSLQLTPADNPHAQWAIRTNLAAWQAEMTRLRGILPTRVGERVRELRFSPDGHRLVTLTAAENREAKGMCRIWDVRGDEPRLITERRRLSHAISNDGKSFVFTGTGSELELWSLDRSAPRARWELRGGKPISRLAISGDGNLIATSHVASTGGSVQLWNSQTQQPIGEPLHCSAKVTALALSPKGQRLLLATEDRATELHDPLARKLLVARQHTHPILRVAFSPNGEIALVAELGGEIQLWHSRTGKRRGSVRHPGAEQLLPCFSPDGRLVVTGGGDHTVRFHQAATAQSIDRTLDHGGPISGMAFRRDGNLLLVGSSDRTARLWDVSRGRPVGSRLPHPHHVSAVAIAPSGRICATACLDHCVRLWTLPDHAPIKPTIDAQDVVWDLAIAPDGCLATASGPNAGPGRVQFWSASDHRPQAKIERAKMVKAIAFAPDGKQLAVGGWNGDVQLYDRTGAALGPPIRHAGPVYEVAFSRDGSRLITGTMLSEHVNIYDLDSQRQLSQLPHASAGVRDSACSRDGRYLLTGGYDKTVRIWNLRTSAMEGEAMPQRGAVGAVAIAPDGVLLAAGNDSHVAQVWNRLARTQVGEPLPHDATVRAVAFSPDSRLLVTGSQDHAARLWEPHSGKRVGPRRRHEGPLEAARFSPEGDWFATAGWDGKVRFWPVPRPLDGTPAELCSRIEILTGLEMDQQTLRPLPPDAWRKRKALVEQRKKASP